MRCSAPRASGSFERRSTHLGRMHSRSGSFEDRAPRVPRPRPDLRSSAPRASAPGRTSRTTWRRDHIGDCAWPCPPVTEHRRSGGLPERRSNEGTCSAV
jgi:hypothetical protein